MENDSIVITAGLKFDASEALIIKQLGEIQDKYNSKGGMQINCKISDESLKAIQNSLGNLTKTLNVNVNAQNIQQSINQAVGNNGVKVNVATELDKKVINKDVDYLKKMFQLGIKGDTLTGFRQQLKPLLQEFVEAYKSFNTQEVENSFNKILDFIDRTKNETIVLNRELKEAQELLKGAVRQDGKMYIDSVTYSNLQKIYDDQKKADKVLNTVFGEWSVSASGKSSLSSWDALSEHLKLVKVEANDLAEAIAGIYNTMSQTVPKGNVFNVIEDMSQIFDAVVGALNLPPDVYQLINGEVWSGDNYDKMAQSVNNVDSSMQSLAADTRQVDVAIEELFTNNADIAKTEENAQKMSQAFKSLQEARDFYKNDKNVDSITAEWIKDADRNITGFTINLNRASGEVEHLKHELNDANEFVFTGSRTSDSGIQKALEKASRTADTLKRQIDDLNFGAQDTSKKNAITDTGSLDRISEAYKKAETAINNLRNADAANFDRLNNEAKIEIDNLDNIIKQERNLATVRREANNEAEKQITSIQKMYEKTIDPNKPNAIKNEQSLTELKTKYEAVITAAEALKGANASTFDDLNQKLKTAIANFDVTKTQLERAENVATKLRTKDVATVKGEELGNLSKFVDKINNSAIPSVENMIDKVNGLRTQLEGAQDKQGLTNYLNTFTIIEKEFEALNAQAKSVKKSLAELDKLGTANTFKEIGANAAVIRDSLKSLGMSTDTGNVNAAKSSFNEILGKIDKATTISDIQAIEKELTALRSMFDDVVKSTNAENEAAKKMADALNTVEGAYKKVQASNKKLLDDKLTDTQVSAIEREIKEQKNLVTQTGVRLRQEGLLTQQILDRMILYARETDNIKQETENEYLRAEAKKEAEAIAKKEEEDAGKILAIYKEIAAQNKILANPNSTDTQKRQAVEAVDREREKLEIMTKELGTQTMLNGKRAEAIAQGERLAADAVEIAREQQQAAQAKKDETEAEKAYKKELQDVNKILKDNIAALEKFNNSAVAKNNASNPLVASQTGLNAGYIAQLQGLQESLANDKSSENVQRVKGRIEELSNTLRDARFNSEALQQSLTNASAEATLEAKIKTLTNQMNAFALNNEKAITSLKKMRSFGGETFESQWGKMMTALSAGNLDAEGLKRLTEQFRIFKTEVQGTGQLTTSFADKMAGQLKMLASRWLSLYAVIGKIRTLINYVVELDTAMTKLKRVTDETAEGYERFLETAKKSARETSTTLTDTVEQAARWAKSGYDAATSAELAKTSLIYSIVGDVDNETAVSDLVTVLRGFNMEAEDSLSIVDKLDALNNKYATDAKSLGEALSVSASAMAAANNDLDQTLALITGASEITQNAKETGQAIRTITMRLRGMKGELEELGEDAEGIESISKVQTQILNLTKGRVNIFDENNNFRSTYDILKEISEVYNELSDPDKANLTEIIFGKLRSNQGLAIINAFQSGQIEKALKDAQNSAGTATEEINKYNESIQAHLNQFKNAAQELSSDAFNTETIKEVIDDGIKLVSMLDSLTRAVTALGDAVPDTLINLLKSLKDKATLNSAKMLIDLADKVSDAEGEIDNLVNGSQSKESKEKRQKIEEEVSATEELTQEYLDLMAAEEDIDEISLRLGDNIADLNDQYSTNQEKIDLVNKSLSENIVLMKEAQKQKTGEWLKENAEGYAEAVEALSHVSEVDQFGSALSAKGDAFAIDAKGFGRYTKKQYEAFANLGLSNYVSGEGTGYVHDFALSGTLEEQLDSLKKIRDAYAKLDDMDEKRLTQFDNEISKLQTKIDTYKNLISQFETYMKQYESMQNLSAQEYNMIEQAINAYQAYQKARLSDDSEGEKNALEALNNIKEIVYSISSPSSALRKDFDDMWGKFVLGETEAISKLEELQTDFNELIDKSFGEELKNLDSIEQAIESMMNDETLSHDDAWNIIKLDTDGILKDIKLVNGEYKLSTDELLQLMQQRINKRKEDIKLIKESAEAELANAKARLASIKINSLGDVKAYAGVIEEIKGDIKDSQEIITKTSYLLDELDTKGRKIERIAGDTGKQLNATVKALEAEVEAIDDTIDDLNERKEAIEEEKSLLEDELAILNEQKEALEETLKNYDAVADVVSDYIKEQTDAIQSQIDALEEEQEAIEKFYNDQIDALQKQNEERDDAIKKEKALADLANAENQKKRTYSSARGWTYESSKEDIIQAQNALAEIETNEQIKALEKERDEKLGGFDERKKEYETQIKAFEDYAEKYASVASDIQKAENELLADQILGSEWRTKIEQQDEELLSNYRSEYRQFNNDLKTLVNTEIANLQASIDMKDKEIKKIDDEITAYNKYKGAVEKNLKEAQTALEEYKSTVETIKSNTETLLGDMANKAESECDRISNAFYEMQDDIWNNHNKILEWINNVTNAFQGLLYETDELRSKDDFMKLVREGHIMGRYANGGTIGYTGLAMVHGSKTNPETVFNATDSKKLYDMIHNTPNLIASVAKQASQIAGFNPSNVKNNTNNSSISVNIGQVVANNPQELTRNLDTHLDSYFKRKLTQSYTQ